MPKKSNKVDPGQPLEWLQDINYEELRMTLGFPYDGEDFCSGMLLQYGLKNRKPVFRMSRQGNITSEHKANLISVIEGLGGTLLMDNRTRRTNNLGFLWKDSVVHIWFVSTDGNDFIEVGWIVSSLSKEFFATLTESLLKNVDYKDSSGKAIQVLIVRDGDMLFKDLSLPVVPFQPLNYLPEVGDSVQHIIKDLDSNDPCGRLILLNGPAGTGKTFLLRGLVSAVPRSSFVVIPPPMIAELSSPSYISAVLSRHRAADSGPLVFILEDADQAIIDRKHGDLSTISTVLNMGDGLLATCLNVRIIATTNAKDEHIDKAIIRDGRLCRHLHLGPLPVEQAKTIYERLGGKKEDIFKGLKEVPLASIYRAIAQGNCNPPLPLPSIGFH